MNFNRRRGFLTASVAALAMLVGTISAHAASVPRFERQLLGIRLMSRGNAVLKKYGSPHRVLVANQAILFYQAVRLPQRDFLTITVTPGDAAAGGAAPGVDPYSGAAPGGAPPGIESGGGAQTAGKFVYWIYQYPQKGITNVFVMDEEGRVVSIGQAGGTTSARTARGVGIGSPYSTVVRSYGFPERHERLTTQGQLQFGLLRISYEESHGVEFIFMNQPLRGYKRPAGTGPWCVGVIVSAVQ